MTMTENNDLTLDEELQAWHDLSTQTLLRFEAWLDFEDWLLGPEINK